MSRAAPPYAVTWMGRVAIAVIIGMVAVVALVTGGVFAVRTNGGSLSAVVEAAP